jgi:hypothetical protein
VKSRIADQDVFAIFNPLGCIRRRQMRSSPKSLPRFRGDIELGEAYSKSTAQSFTSFACANSIAG